MGKAEIAKYAAVFGAGAFAVLGVIGLNSLLTSDPQASELNNQINSTPIQSSETQPKSAGEAEEPVGSDESVATQSQGQPETSATASAQPTAPSNSEGDTSQTINIADLQRNTMVTVEGVVTSIRDEDEFVLTDQTGSIPIYTGKSLFTVEQGQLVALRGFVDDGLILEIYAQEIRFADGSMLSIEHLE